MAATRERIKSWLDNGVKDGMKYVLVYCDTFDYDDYPVFAKDIDEFWEKYNDLSYQLSNMQRLMEVYDLSLNIERQLNEKRAMHLPQKEK